MEKLHLLYLGSNEKFALKLKKEIEDSICLSILNTSNVTILECLQKIKYEFPDCNSFDGYVLQAESYFIDQKILSDSPGIYFLKHLLLTEEMGDYRRKNIICLSFFQSHYHLKRSADNAILFSPEINLSDIILQPEELALFIKNKHDFYNREFFKEEEHFEKNLNNYIVWTDNDELSYKHDIRNYHGLISLYREFFGLNPGQFQEKMRLLSYNKTFKNDINKLAFKKKIFRKRWVLSPKRKLF